MLNSNEEYQKALNQQLNARRQEGMRLRPIPNSSGNPQQHTEITGDSQQTQQEWYQLTSMEQQNRISQDNSNRSLASIQRTAHLQK